MPLTKTSPILLDFLIFDKVVHKILIFFKFLYLELFLQRLAPYNSISFELSKLSKSDLFILIITYPEGKEFK